MLELGPLLTFIKKKEHPSRNCRGVCCVWVPQDKAARAGLQAAERQACWTLWAQVLSSSVSECLSGSCSSLDVMVLWTFSRKLLVPAGRRQSGVTQRHPWGASVGTGDGDSHHTGPRGRPSTGSAPGSRQGLGAAAAGRSGGSCRLEGRSGVSRAVHGCPAQRVHSPSLQMRCTVPLLLLWDGSRLIRNLTSRRATSPCRMLGTLWRSSSSCFLFLPQTLGLLRTERRSPAVL